jgi:F-type H+-transporting ATPase subunit b
MIDLDRFHLIIQLAIVLGMVIILTQVAFKPFLQVLQNRRERIDGAEKRALELQQRANELMVRYKEAIAAAQAQGVAVREEIRKESLAKETEVLQKAMEEANQKIQQIKKEITAEAVQARGILQAKTQTLSREIAEKILGRSLS